MSNLRYALPGLALGFSLHWIGFTSYDEVHAFFTLSDLRLLYTFLLGVTVAATGYFVIKGQPPPRPMHKGILPGAALFGLGWAVTGACPGVAFAQLGEGQLLAIWSVLGIALGNWIFGRVNRRFLHLDPGTCES